MQVLERLMYIGPNRRADQTVAEWLLEIPPNERSMLETAADSGFKAIRDRAEMFGLVRQEPAPQLRDRTVVESLAAIAGDLAIALQRKAGHRVRFKEILPIEPGVRCRLVFEYEQGETGADAGELAFRIIADAIHGLVWDADPDVPGDTLDLAIASFLSRAAQRVLPLDAEALIEAAVRLDIPWVKLEREPYGEVAGDFRIRPEGLLKFGHSCYQHVVDGTLCIDRNAALIPLVFDREKVFECLVKLGAPVPRQDTEFRNLLTAKRAVRAAERVGFPVMLKTVARRRVGEHPASSASGIAASISTASSSTALGSTAPGSTSWGPLRTASEVEAAFEQCRGAGGRAMVERFVEGTKLQLLIANHEWICAVTDDRTTIAREYFHPSIIDMALRISRALNAGLLRISVITPDAGRSLGEAGGAVIDIDPAPQLDRWLHADGPHMARAAEGFLRWLYPPGTRSRMPLIAVTGTNGKTTTSKMLSRILKTAGFKPGLATTRGIFLDEKLHKSGDLAGTEGHHLVFESMEVNAGVLETARGGVVSAGFMFDWCDVGVCVNVTPDHIGTFGVETLEEMTAVKRSILARARKAVVLNADYDTCRSMLPFAEGVTVYLASVDSTADVLRGIEANAWLCVVEQEAGQDFLVLYAPDGSRNPMIAVAGIPATLGGAATFNISNAQHALCAALGLGLPAAPVLAALARFDASFESNPGRLNIYRELPFTVIMDYAHNADGMQRLGEVITRLDAKGKKIVLCAVTANRSDEELAALVHAVRPHFDHFVCRCYPGARGATRPEIPWLMKAEFLKEGVPEECITVVEVSEEAAITTLRLARPGDILLMCPGTMDIDEMWEVIVNFRPNFEAEDQIT